jgi:hypothetical protein
MFRRIFVIVAALGLVPSWAAQADLESASAINKAGRQRMLSQRIAKTYCQVALGISPQASQAQLEASVELFDRQLIELTRFVRDPESRSATADVARIWGPYRIRATGPVSREGCAELANASEPLLAAAHRLTGLVEAHTPGYLGRLVNVSGRQRMITQRLSLLYMVSASGSADASLQGKMDTAAAEFTVGLEELRSASESMPALRYRLDAVALEWEWFRSVLDLHGEASYGELVATASESILASLEQLTREYEALSGNL